MERAVFERPKGASLVRRMGEAQRNPSFANILDNLRAAALVQDTVGLVVQVNGKVWGKVSVAADATKDVIEAMALVDENVQRFTEGKNVVKVIVVPGRLVNVVVK